MAKGDYTRKYGGSKSGYKKGVRDTLKVVGAGLVTAAVAVVTIIFSDKKR